MELLDILTSSRKGGASAMTDRRQFLAGLAALPLTTLAGHRPHVAASPTELSIPCPDPSPGSVSNQVGSISGTPLTDLVDAYSQVSGVDWQHQLYSVLTNEPGACAHYRQNQTMGYEHWLIVVQIAYRSDRQPAPFATGAYRSASGSPTRMGRCGPWMPPTSRTAATAPKAASAKPPAAL
jgi:hypothetical protein